MKMEHDWKQLAVQKQKLANLEKKLSLEKEIQKQNQKKMHTERAVKTLFFF